MAYIGLSNFRKFKSLEKLDLNDINIFVGKNNAGKSTVVKAIMLVLDNIRDLRWRNVNSGEGLQALQNAPQPIFRFDANGFHNLHIGTFGRAKCNFTDDKCISFNLDYQGVGFEIIVASDTDDTQVSSPIQKIIITINNRIIFGLDFLHQSMNFKLLEFEDNKEELGFDDHNFYSTANNILEIKKEIDKAIKKGDALRVAQLQQEFSKQQRIQETKRKVPASKEHEKITEATFDLTYYHENIGENILVQYLKSLLKVADSNVYTTRGTGTMLGAPKVLRKNTKAYKTELEKRQFIGECRDIINASADALETVIDNINVDYIQAHAATQKLILSADESQDINSKVVHEFFQEGIQPGEKADRFLNKWLNSFEIAQGLSIEPLDGEGYYVKVETENGKVHLADMGMGSIQLIILLLRLATIGNRSETTRQPWWIIIEEPEQNMHPKIQSLLADMFKDFQEMFNSMLILETHSEYLIRKTQLMLAEKNYQEDDDLSDWHISVYYFPSEKDRQPYDMQYQLNGLFAKRFDSGFFDEASSMHMKILKRSRSNKQ